CREMRIPVIVGNTVGYDVTLEIMECGPAAVLVGVGPGAACTSRGVLGLGVPQVTATVDCAAARDAYFKKTSRYVPIITDGGMSNVGARNLPEFQQTEIIIAPSIRTEGKIFQTVQNVGMGTS